MIRRAEKKDIAKVMDLLQQVLSVHHEGRPDIFKEKGSKYTKEELLKIFKNDDTPVFVYTDESDNVLGHVFCQIIRRNETANTLKNTSIYIDDLCIDEKQRGRGIGTALYNYIKKYAEEHDFDSLTLHVWECNESGKEFYKGLGMKVMSYTMEEKIK